MAVNTWTASKKNRLTALISTSVLVTGLLLMAFVSGTSESSSASGHGSGLHATH